MMFFSTTLKLQVVLFAIVFYTSGEHRKKSQFQIIILSFLMLYFLVRLIM